MKRALGEAAVVAEAEVDDRMKRALSVAAVAAEAEVDEPMTRALGGAEAEEVVEEPLKRPSDDA